VRLLTTLRWGFLGTAWFATSFSTFFAILSGCGEDARCTTIGCEDAAPVGSAATGGGAGGGSSQSFIDEGAVPGAGGADTLQDGEACRQVSFGAQTSPVNVHILLDRSTSMLELADPLVPGVTRWDAVTAALRAFVNSPQAADARIGLQFFGLINGVDDCGVDKYITPAVPVAPLASNRDALLAAIDATRPGSFTPTAPALKGALTYALQVAERPENTDVPTVVILASDGIPSECGPLDDTGQMIVSFREIIDTLRSYSQPARDAAGTPLQPPVLTYIVGTQELKNNAAALADAGGGQAFLVGGGTGGGADLQAKFLDALLSIVVKPLDCEIDVPQTAPDTGEVIDFDQVRVRFTGASSGLTTEFPRVDNLAGCAANNAWFYEDANPPKKIYFCRRACESLGAGDLQLELGCAPSRILR
jgi:hypothetical protein